MSYLPKSAWIAGMAAALWQVKSSGLTNQDMADAMGCSDQTVANALNGVGQLDAYFVHRARLAWPDAMAPLDRLGVRS